MWWKAKAPFIHHLPGCLGLLHGAQPDALVVCHALGRAHCAGADFTYRIFDVIAQNEQHGRLVNPSCKVIALSCNTKAMTKSQKIVDGSAKFSLPAMTLCDMYPAIADILATLSIN